MLEIAGGIVIAFLIIALLPYILESLTWLLAVAFCIVIAAGVWFGLTLAFGPLWASAICLLALMAWLIANERNGVEIKRGKPAEGLQSTTADPVEPNGSWLGWIFGALGSVVAMGAAIIVAGFMVHLFGDIGMLIGCVICIAVPLGIAMLWKRAEHNGTVFTLD